MGDGEGFCYFWNETCGQKGSSEGATILIKYLNGLPDHVKHVVFYCDTCGGQNRNATVIPALHYFVSSNESPISVIDLKFMESGHSQMEVDSIHAAIETQRTKSEVFIPSEWLNIFRLSRP